VDGEADDDARGDDSGQPEETTTRTTPTRNTDTIPSRYGTCGSRSARSPEMRNAGTPAAKITVSRFRAAAAGGSPLSTMYSS